jgi:hypothetical protein
MRGSRKNTQRQPADRGRERHHKRAAHRRGRTAQQAAQHVTSEVVRSQEERDLSVARPGRRQQLIAKELLVNAVRRKPGAKDTEQHQTGAAIKADHRRGITIEFTPHGTQHTGRALFTVYVIVGHTIPYASTG